MAIVFDPINKYIKITSGTSITALEIYNEVIDWHYLVANMGYSVPMATYGKFALGGGAFSDIIYVLQDGWKIKLYDGTYQFIVEGTVITDDETIRTVQPDSGEVEVTFQVSSQGIIGEGLNEEEIVQLIYKKLLPLIATTYGGDMLIALK